MKTSTATLAVFIAGLVFAVPQAAYANSKCSGFSCNNHSEQPKDMTNAYVPPQSVTPQREPATLPDTDLLNLDADAQDA